MHQKTIEWILVWFGSLLCISLLLPNHYQPWLSFHQEGIAAIAVIPLIAWSLWRQYSDPNPKLPWAIIAALIVPALAVEQLLTRQLIFHSDALLAIFFSLLFAGSVLSGKNLVTRESFSTRKSGLSAFWFAWIWAGIFSVGIALHQWLNLSYSGLFIIDLPPNGRPFANLAQPNHLATLLLLSITGILYAYQSNKLGAWSTCAAIIFFCFGLAMTQSRSVLIGLLVALVAFHVTRSRYQLRLPVWSFGALIFTFLICSILWPSVNSALLIANETQSTLGRTDPGVRVTYWHSALEAIAMRPVAGWGFGQIGMAQQATALSYPATHTFFSSAHNILLDLLLWMGIPITVLVITLLWRHLRQQKLPNTDNSAAWAALTGVSCIFGHALVEFPLFYTYFLIPFGFLLGIMSGRDECKITNLYAIKLHKFCILFVATVAPFIYTKMATEYFSWEKDSQNLNFELQQYKNTEPAFIPEYALLDQIAVMHEVARSKPDRNMRNTEIQNFKKNAERYPSSLALLRYAYAAALNGRPDKASRTLNLLCSMHRENVCAAAREEWQRFGQEKWPELKNIKFPSPDETLKHKEKTK